VHSITYSQDGQLLASVAADKIIRLWASSTGESCGVLEGHMKWVSAIVFSPDSKFLASASTDRTVRLWEIRTGEVRKLIESEEETFTFAFSPAGKLLACGLVDGDIHIRDSFGGEVHHMLKGHKSLVTKLVFSPDGHLLASGGYDHTVLLWDIRTGSQLQQVAPYDINKMSFSVDGTYLKTNCGLIRIMPHQSCSPDPLLSFCRWTLQREWFCYDNHKVLWLPAEFRPKYPCI
jgi:WD40 repeat protein